ncbi:hypothetical protein COCOBI_19-2070 [Coccomyxa sp. Obi]|nr:hypothetical protein COCOBI_19-2070 [Coccomyxa sp. Obi]
MACKAPANPRWWSPARDLPWQDPHMKTCGRGTTETARLTKTGTVARPGRENHFRTRMFRLDIGIWVQ